MPEMAWHDWPAGETLAKRLRHGSLKLNGLASAVTLTLLAAAHATYGRALSLLVSGTVVPALAVWALART